MQNKKVTMLAAVLAVTVIAMAGVGYAISYTATTTNTDNYMDTTYVKLTQSSNANPTAAYTGNFLTDLYFDTVNAGSSSSIVYKPVFTGNLNNHVYSTDASLDKNAALISRDLTLTVTPSKEVQNKTGELTVSIGAGQFTKQTGLDYIMLITGTDNGNTYKLSEKYDGGWTFADLPMDKEHTYNVKLFVAFDGTATSVDTNVSGFAAKTSTDENKAVFTFELKASDE